MAVPVISVDSTGGSSDTTASGAGPVTAISGSTGRTRNTASQLRFGMFGATDDFSGVATDGSAVLYFAVSTAGQRNFSSIAGTKNTSETDVGSITSGAAILSAIVSTTGYSVGDVIKVTGAGAASADLYSTILTVDSATQVTLNDTAGTTVVLAVIVNPKQLTLTTGQGVNTGATNTAWAVGGKRATVAGTNSVKLLENNAGSGDAMPGWVIEMQSGHSETTATTITIRRAGDTTSGPITLRGVAGAATLPVITLSTNATAVNTSTEGKAIKDFEIRNSNATKTASVGINLQGGSTLVSGVKVSHSTNKFFNSFVVSGAGGQVRDCEAGYCAGIGISLTDGQGHQIVNNFVHDCGATAGISSVAQNVGVRITGNICYSNTGDGIRASLDASYNRMLVVSDNTCNANTGDGIEITSAVATVTFAVENNILSNNGGYGLHCSAAADAALAFSGVLMLANQTYNNTSGAYKSTTAGYAYNTCPWAAGDTGLDPTYTNAATGDFSIGTNLKAKGYPLAGSLYVGKTSTTYSYVDPGASQRQESAGGGGGPLVGGRLVQ